MHEVERSGLGTFAEPLTMQDAVEALRAKVRNRGFAICISGIDGSGKTTLARNLVQVMQASDVRVQYKHWYQWYVNVLVTPVFLLVNRYFGHKVLVFDRTILDNIAVGLSARKRLQPLLRVLLAIVLMCYPKFEYRIYLVASFAETQRRRPGTSKAHFASLQRIYGEIALRAQYLRLRSNEQLLCRVLRYLGQ